MNIPQYEIKFNPEFDRYEVFSPKSVVRNGEKQPVFVSALLSDCAEYAEKARLEK